MAVRWGRKASRRAFRASMKRAGLGRRATKRRTRAFRKWKRKNQFMKSFILICQWLRKFDCLPNNRATRRSQVRYWLDVTPSHLLDEVKSGSKSHGMP